MRLKTNFKLIFMPTFFLIVIFALFYYVFQDVYSKISKTQKDLKESQRLEQQLEQKVNQLREISNEILGETNTALLALPEKNPSILSLYNIKSLASEKSLDLSGIESSVSSSKDGLLRAELTFAIKFSDFPILIEYLKSLKNSLPILVFDEINLEDKENNKEANVVLSLYFSPLPERISQISEPIKSLTSDDLEMLEKLSSYKLPEFIDIQPQGENTRENPFQ